MKETFSIKGKEDQEQHSPLRVKIHNNNNNRVIKKSSMAICGANVVVGLENREFRGARLGFLMGLEQMMIY